jgi:hypothetical protein
MNDQDRELVERIVSAVGEAGKHGYEALVRYQVVDGIVSAICFAAMLAAAIWAFRKLLAWQPKDDFDADMRHFARGLGFVACAIAIFGMLAGTASNIVQALQPEGSIIKLAITKATKD